MWHSGGLAKTCLTATLPGIVTTKVLWQIKTLMSSLVSCLLMSANNQKDDILLQQCESRKGIKLNSKVFLYILDAFFTASGFVYNFYTYIFVFVNNLFEENFWQKRENSS